MFPGDEIQLDLHNSWWINGFIVVSYNQDFANPDLIPMTFLDDRQCFVTNNNTRLFRCD